jgi:hypothetical protein
MIESILGAAIPIGCDDFAMQMQWVTSLFVLISSWCCCLEGSRDNTGSDSRNRPLNPHFELPVIVSDGKSKYNEPT